MGKGKYGDRPSLMVDLVNTEALTEIALQILSLQYTGTLDMVESFRNEGWKVDGPLVVAYDHEVDTHDEDRKYSIVCTEGVGYHADDYGRVSVPLINQMGWTRQFVEIYSKILWDLRTGEQVDFADHVRTFGDRLEGNFSIWYNRFITPSTVNA